MGNAVFPTLPGLMPNIAWAPTWSTNVQQAVSGREIRGTYQVYPLHEFSLGYEVLRDAKFGVELATLFGFFNARQGDYDSFLFSNPSDSSVTTASFGTGDGATTAFQLVRAYGAGGFTWVEPVQNLNGSPSIYKAGVLQTLTTNYSISSTGLVTFVTAPAASAALTWTGSFYYRCRFLDPKTTFQAIYTGLWENKRLAFRGSPVNLV